MNAILTALNEATGEVRIWVIGTKVAILVYASENRIDLEILDAETTETLWSRSYRSAAWARRGLEKAAADLGLRLEEAAELGDGPGPETPVSDELPERFAGIPSGFRWEEEPVAYRSKGEINVGKLRIVCCVEPLLKEGGYEASLTIGNDNFLHQDFDTEQKAKHAVLLKASGLIAWA